MTQFNKLPQFFEELKIDQKTTVEDLYFQLKQQIPINYLEINLEEGNYCGSTNPKWKNKPLCERYFFTYQEREIQLDIPHELMDKLRLEKGADLTQPLYLDPKVLDRPETYKGITIENETEIILINSNKLIMKDQGVQTEPNLEKEQELKKLREELATWKQNYLVLEDKWEEETFTLKRQLGEKEQELKKWIEQFLNESASQVQTRINNVNSQLTNANTTINQKNTEIANLTNQVNTLVNQNAQNAILSQISTSLTRWLAQLEKQQRENEAEKLLKLKLSFGSYQHWAENSILTLTQCKYLKERMLCGSKYQNFWNDLRAKCEIIDTRICIDSWDCEFNYEKINKVANYLKSIGVN